jgi:hypothetical protein
LKFGDVIVAVASSAVITLIVGTLLEMALIPVNSFWGLEVATIVSILVSGVVVGYAFAGNIREESRMASIAKIAILSAVVFLLAVMAGYGALYHFGPRSDETLQNMYHTSSWTNTDWFAYEEMILHIETTLPVVFALVFGFIGLYLGSMHKPSAKTKE